MKTITLTVTEILDLAEAAGLKVEKPAPIDSDDMETVYVIVAAEDGEKLTVGDDKGENQKPYRRTAYLEDYPEEGTYPLGEPIA